MDLSSQDEEIPIPINSSYGGGHGHMIHHDNHIMPSSAPPQMVSNGSLEDHVPSKKVIKYKECLKNHAAAMGGNATDGCGEFMPSGEEGTVEALNCSACNCHRNFHRKEIQGDQNEIHPFSYDYYHNNPPHLNRVGRKVSLGYARAIPPHQMIMSYNVGPISSLPSESEEDGGGGGGGGGVLARVAPLMKKRFRTKFSQEQKDKMLNFAEKVGWKFQKQDEGAVQQFCQEIGVKRRVLKVWMHNNKHNLAKKNPSSAAAL